MNKPENTMFSMNLYYDALPTKFEQQNTQYNGNIAAIEWNAPIDESTMKLQGYEFDYDVLNRLTKADYKNFTDGKSGAYSTSYSYDKNGNIKTLRRFGQDMLIDNLNYIYDGNQLLEVLDEEDGGSTPLPDKSGSSLTLGFNAIASGHYTYDYNGNLETNPAKGINEIDYNKLNLPTEVETINGSINYLYSASGEKLRKFVGSENHYYIGMFEFDHEHKFIFAHTEEGRIRMVNGTAKFDYALKDHLGNTRVMFTVTDNNDIELMESNHYYPFGMRFNQTSDINTGVDNKYLYNGKELQEDLGLNWYDYGARFYDPAIGRWSVIDNKAEKYYSFNPYMYAANNPILVVDPDGNDIVIWYNDDKGKQQPYRFTGSSTNMPNNKYVKSVVTAWNYNVGNGGGDPSFNAATNDKITINVVETDGRSMHLDGTVYWNPELGTKTDKGVVRSPASVLDHEMDHGVQGQTNKEQFDKDRTPNSDSQYDTKEERRVITGSEQKTSKANGEISDGQVTRTNHKGTPVVTKGVTSAEIDANKTKQYQKKQNERDYWTPEY